MQLSKVKISLLRHCAHSLALIVLLLHISSAQNALERSRPRVLKMCPTNSSQNRRSTSVKIPTWFAGEAFNSSYSLVDYIVAGRDVSNPCKTDENLSTTVTTSISIGAYLEEFEELQEAPSLSPIHRFTTLLLENGYLCVGKGDGSSADYYSPEEFCLEEIMEEDLATMATFRTCSRSKDRPILPKCCPVGMVWGERGCVVHPEDGSEHQFDPGYLAADNLGHALTLEEANPAYRYYLFKCFLEPWDEDKCHREAHPLTDNRAVFIGANRRWEYLNLTNTNFCFDQKLNGSLVRTMGVCEKDDDPNKESKSISFMYMVGMYIGAVFHLMTSLVYLSTWKLQNIHGRTLCSCTISLFFMTTFMGNAHALGLLEIVERSAVCVANAIIAHYFYIASFSWLLVVNIDLWRTFTSIRKDGSKSMKRLLKYCCLGWGFPLVVTVVSVVLHFTFPCRTSRVLTPEYGVHHCFVAPWAQGPYVYYILASLIALSYIFAGITLFSLYFFKKDASNLRSTKMAQDRQTVIVFLKLTVVMGLSWVFEVISWAATLESNSHVIWILLDFYNALSAILIFIIFVCKKTTLDMLEKSYPVFKGLTAAFTRVTTLFSGENSSKNTSSTGVSRGNELSASRQIIDGKKSVVAKSNDNSQL